MKSGVNIGLCGAHGYVGQMLIKLILSHPHLTLTGIFARKSPGRYQKEFPVYSMHELVEKKDQIDVLFIIDEIQTGMGRTGKPLALQHEGIKPDGILLGKALGGGLLPISLFLAKNSLMQVLKPGNHGSTFGGNPLASFVAYEAINTLVDEKLSEQAAELGDYFLEQLKQINTPAITHVRGKGLLIAIELNTNVTEPQAIFEKLIKKGLLTLLTKNKTIRLLPPLIITKQQIDHAVEIIHDVFS